MGNTSRILTQCVAGMVLLTVAGIAGAYAGAAVTAFTMGLLGGVGELASGAALVVASAWLIRSGLMGKHRGGYALAPVALFGLWLCASVAMRLWLSTAAASLAPPATVDPALPKIRTLVVDAYPPLARTFVSEGIIDRLVEISYEGNNRSHPIESILQTQLSRGSDCTAKDFEQSYALHKAGRVEECLKTVELSQLPDGLHILQPLMDRTGTNPVRELSAVVVNAGQGTTGLTWRRGQSRVPAYVPIFRMNMGPFNRAQTIWETRTGPFEWVFYGAVDLTTATMASAIYGFDASKPLKPIEATPAELSERAAVLAGRGQSSELVAAWKIVSELSAFGYVDDNSVKVAVQKIRNIETYPEDKLSLAEFVEQLTAVQRAAFNDGVIHLLSTPEPCDWCFVDHVPWRDEALAARAVEKFRDSVGLERWQYSGLIWAADALIWNGRSVSKPSKNRESIFQIAVSSNDASASLRLASFIVSTRSEMLDKEVRALIPELGKLDGDDLHYVATRGYNSPGEIAGASKILKDFPLDIFVQQENWVDFWNAMLAHTDIIANAENREMAKRHSVEKRQED